MEGSLQYILDTVWLVFTQGNPPSLSIKLFQIHEVALFRELSERLGFSTVQISVKFLDTDIKCVVVIVYIKYCFRNSTINWPTAKIPEGKNILISNLFLLFVICIISALAVISLASMTLDSLHLIHSCLGTHLSGDRWRINGDPSHPHVWTAVASTTKLFKWYLKCLVSSPLIDFFHCLYEESIL